jgi:hypothetical protein
MLTAHAQTSFSTGRRITRHRLTINLKGLTPLKVTLPLRPMLLPTPRPLPRPTLHHTQRRTQHHTQHRTLQQPLLHRGRGCTTLTGSQCILERHRRHQNLLRLTLRHPSTHLHTRRLARLHPSPLRHRPVHKSRRGHRPTRGRRTHTTSSMGVRRRRLLHLPRLSTQARCCQHRSASSPKVECHRHHCRLSPLLITTKVRRQNAHDRPVRRW